MSLFVDSLTSSLLLKSLEFCLEKQKVIANNIANAGVSNYKAMKIDDRTFVNLMDKIYESDNANSEKQKLTSNINVPNTLSILNTESSVILDYEMMELSKNTLQYQSLLALKKGHSDIMYSAIKDGKSA